MITIIFLLLTAICAIVYVVREWLIHSNEEYWRSHLDKVCIYNWDFISGDCSDAQDFSISVLQGEFMLQFKLNLPKKSFHDVVERRLSVFINGLPYKSMVVDAEVRSIEGLECSHEDRVTGTLVDVDNAGNESEARRFEFIVLDNVAPPKPEEVMLDVVGQGQKEEPVAEEPVAEEPVAEEPVAEEPVAEEPVADEPVADEPAADEPAADEPAADEPAADEPAADEPAADEPEKQ